MASARQIASFGGNDTGGYGGFQVKRAADGQYPIAHGHFVGIAQPGRRERLVFRWINLDQRQVGFTVHAYDLGLMQHGSGLIKQLYADAVGLIHHVEVGHDVAIGVQNHA